MPRSAESPSAPKAPRRTPAYVYVAVVAPVAIAVVAAATQPWLPPSHLLRDSQVVAGLHGDSSPAYGLLSNLGILALAVASGMALLGWLIARRTGDELGPLLAWSFALGLVFVLDDLLLLHEAASGASWTGIAIAAGYGIAFLAYLARFRDVARRRLDGGMLLIAIAAFAGSAVVDLLVDPTQASVLIEDGAKLLGIMAWSVFVARAAILAFEPMAAPSVGSARVETAARRERVSEPGRVTSGPPSDGNPHGR